MYKSGASIWIHLKMEAKKTDGERFFEVNITLSPTVVVLWVFLKIDSVSLVNSNI